MDSMKKKTENRWQTRIMLACFGLLIVAMCIVFLRFFTAKVMIHKLHEDNVWTNIVFADNPGIKDAQMQEAEKKVTIDWQKLYPFENQEEKPLFVRLRDKQVHIEGIFHEKAVKKLEDWTTKYFWNYPVFVEAGRSYEKQINWHIVNPSMEVAEMDDGYLTYVYKRRPQNERIQSVINFRNFVEANGGKFFFVQAPCKVNPYGDKKINQHIDFTNENADELVNGLSKADVNVLDLRKELSCSSDDTAWHALFYRTDHHWLPQTAIKAANFVADELRTDGININNNHYSEKDYQWILYSNYFLGSQGKKVTLAKTKPEDFELAKPAFSVNWHVRIPEKAIDEIGGFDLIYDKRMVQRCDYYNLNPYAAYSYGDQPIMYYTNLNMPDDGQKVLAITDSYGDTMIPFLAVGVREIIKVDARHFTGSLQKLVEEEKPDVVFVMSTPSYAEPIDWVSHKDKFDFR